MTAIRTVQVLIKLLPSVLVLRKDRKKWVNQKEGARIDQETVQKERPQGT